MPIVVSASETAYNTSASQVADGARAASHKWFSLQDNKLDGTYHPISAGEQVGWWGTSISDAGGNLLTPPTLTIEETRSIWSIQVSGDSLLDEYPVDFTVELYDGAALLHTHNVVGNTQVNYSGQLPQVFDVTKIVFTFTKVNKAGRSVKIVEALSDFNLARTDTLNVVLSNTVQAGIGIFASDVLTIAVSDNADPVSASLNAADELLINAAESKAITNKITRTDTLTPMLTEAKHVTANVNSSDSFALKAVIEHFDFTAELFQDDNLLVRLDEHKVLDNIYTAMDAGTRQVFAKVEITYTDPYMDESIVISATETAEHTHTDELADAITTPPYKWFSLHNNKLDGSYHPLPGDQSSSVGWWGTQLSDANGYLTNPPVITVAFSVRTLAALKLVGDSQLDCYATDFTYKVYDASDVELYTHEVTNNTLVDWNTSIVPVVGAAKLTLTVLRLNKPGVTAKLTEMYTAVVQTYDAEMLESISLLEEIGYNTGSLPIGNISSNEIDITISNADRRFDLNNASSRLRGFVKRNRRIRVWMGAYVGNDIEWVPMGTFWSTSWDISKDSLVATVTGRDRLELLRQTDFTISIVYDNYTLYDLFEIILQDAGLLSEEYELDATLSSVVIPHAWFAKMSHREALQHLAGCAVIQVFCTKEGKIKVNLDLDATPTVMHTFDDDVNVYGSKYPLAVSEQVNYVEVVSKQWTESSTETLYESTDIIDIAANSSITRTFEFTQMPATSLDAPIIAADTGIAVDSYTLYAWGAEIVFTNSQPTPGTITSVKLTGKILKDTGTRTFVAKDDQSIQEDSKLKVNIEHPFIQDATYAQSLADSVLTTFKEARYDVVLDNRGSAPVRLGDKVLVSDAYDNVLVPYVVSRQQIQWNGFLQATTEGKKL